MSVGTFGGVPSLIFYISSERGWFEFREIVVGSLKTYTTALVNYYYRFNDISLNVCFVSDFRSTRFKREINVLQGFGKRMSQQPARSLRLYVGLRVSQHERAVSFASGDYGRLQL